MIDYYKPIPQENISFCSAINKQNFENENFIQIVDNEFVIVDMQYYKMNIPLATENCFVREQVYKRLISAALKLPKGHKFKIYDAWRPLTVQKWLYNKLHSTLIKKYKNLSSQDLQKVIKQYVSVPSDDVYSPPVHTTGGAIDLTIINESNVEYNMGTKFDDFIENSYTRYFEHSDNDVVRQNRRILYNIMITSGFTNLSSEWWHFDFGDSFWSKRLEEPAKYIGVFEEKSILECLKK